MARQPIVLITGANGEVGHGLIDYLHAQPDVPEIVVLDLHPLAEHQRAMVKEVIVGDIRDDNLLNDIHDRYEIDTIYHLAALLSTTGERNPALAHDVNVQGSAKLLQMASRESDVRGAAVKFIYPSSIAVYGLPNLATKAAHEIVHEEQFLQPTTMYGCNKLYVEHLGRYYATHYKQLMATRPLGVDFRCVRFPGLISAHTVPSGGTSDFGPEMIHAAAQGDPYDCFVRADTIIPFMAMPDAVHALIQLAKAPRAALSRQIYNITSFSLTAAEFAQIVRQAFPLAQINFAPDAGRQAIVDTWPVAVDDRTARADWGWSPAYDMHRAFADYLLPHIRDRYAQAIGE
jgi:threonine 3-dehydrogenase